jgi:ElaB/YqjD/DUF883 family membrane-anchored ribosome-binding protein
MNGSPRAHLPDEGLPAGAARLADARAEVRSTLDAIEGAVRDRFDWREWVKRNPWVAVAVAGAFGWRLGRGRWL